ncbi:MAG TPA: type IV pilin protein [Frateuria sp.]|uniref:type IV pilin protein n=1 Tax=Frateuria sp. TaxID=2211372 RepID=UPI002D80A414|nr:type IV pilin protein [Frateuria sp.]HET6805381.1 type IV pilin protein [Frateuria sp.]
MSQRQDVRTLACPAAPGFSLIELMVVLAIVAILAAIAYPSYTSHLVKAHRVAAAGCLSEYSNYMERFYTTNLSYDKTSAGVDANDPLPVLGCAAASETGQYYKYDYPADGSTTALAAGSYTIEAAPLGAQKARDTQCGTLSIDQTGKREVSGSGTVQQCW